MKSFAIFLLDMTWSSVAFLAFNVGWDYFLFQRFPQCAEQWTPLVTAAFVFGIVFALRFFIESAWKSMRKT